MLSTDDTIDVLLFEESLYGGISALVQSDGRTVYFYLQGDATFGTRACWVRNLEPGPWVFSDDDLRNGRPPLLPRVHVVNQSLMAAFDAAELRVVWFPEGNGAYLLAGQEVLAVIPPWSGHDGFHGYARDCSSENLVCWPLPPRDALLAALARAESFWQQVSGGALFRQMQPQIVQTYEQSFGAVEQYYSIDGGRFPPRGAVICRGLAGRVLATVGMSLCPQPNVPTAEQSGPEVTPWIELAMACANDTTPKQLAALVHTLSGVARMPWHQWTWLGQGQIIEIATEAGPPQRWRLTASPPASAGPGPLLPTPHGSRAELLWLVPDACQPENE